MESRIVGLDHALYISKYDQDMLSFIQEKGRMSNRQAYNNAAHAYSSATSSRNQSTIGQIFEVSSSNQQLMMKDDRAI